MTSFKCTSYIKSNSIVIVDEELERIWKNDVTAYFKILLQHFPGGTDANYEKLLWHPV
jgi:hypothetical protein